MKLHKYWTIAYEALQVTKLAHDEALLQRSASLAFEGASIYKDLIFKVSQLLRQLPGLPHVVERLDEPVLHGDRIRLSESIAVHGAGVHGNLMHAELC